MRTIIGFLCDPCVHLLLIGLLLVRLAFLTGPESADAEIVSCLFENCPVCKLIQENDTDTCPRHGARPPVAVASK